MSSTARKPDPWAPVPTMEATPQYSPPTPHEVGRGEALVRYNARQQWALAQESEAAAEHRYREQVRVVERDAIRARVDRVEDRIAREQPLFRDAAFGFAAISAPLGMLISGSKLEGNQRSAAYLAACVVGAFGGAQWMEHRSSGRRARSEDELDRLTAKLSQRSIPNPAPAPRMPRDPYDW